MKIPKLSTPSILIIGVIGFYAIWAGYHFQELGDASQKELAHAAEVVDGAVETARRNVKELDLAYLKQFLLEQPYVTLEHASAKFPEGPLKVDVRGEASGVVLELYRDGKEKTDPWIFHFRTEKLLAELTFPASFRTVALVKHSGEVVASMPVQGNAWRRHLRFSETRNREPRFGDDPAWPVVDLKAAMDGRAGKEIFNSLSGAASRTRTEIGGTTYELYLQPLRLRTVGTERIYLAGLTPSSAVLRRAMAMDTFLLAAACLALAILMVGMPFVKLFVLHARERFRVLDLKSLYISTGALLTLAATVLMTGNSYLSFESAAESIQQDLHKTLAGKFAAELREARAQLDAFNAACAKPIEFKNMNGANAIAVDQIAWIKRDAMQAAKFTPTDERADKLSVGHREYFRAVAANTLFRLSDDPPGAKPFFIGPARSISDGQFYSFVSAASNEQCGRDVIAAAITFPLFSLGERPLPAGFGFALIHRDGTVLYHSDGRLALRENLLDEVSRDARLRAVVLADQPNDFDSGYHGAPHHFHVAPLAEVTSASGPPFVLITFHELTPSRYVTAHTFLSTLLWTMPALFLWMAVAIFAAGWLTKKRAGSKEENGTRWIWTQPDRTNDYKHAALAIAALGAIALFLAAFHIYQFTLLAAALTPLIAIWFVIWKTPGQGAPGRASHWHRWVVISIAVTMNVVPVIGVQRIIWGHEAGKFVEYSNTQARERERDLPEEWAAKLTSERVFPERVEHAKAVRAAQLKGPLQMGPGVDWPLAGLDWMRPVQDWLAWHLPLRNDTAIGLRGRVGKMYGPPVSAWWLLVLGFGGAGLLLCYWVHWNSTHLLLAGAGTSAVNATLDWKNLTDEQRLLLVQIDREGIAHPRHREQILALCEQGWLYTRPQLAPTVDIANIYAADVARIAELETPGEGEGWAGTAGSIIAALIAAVLFLASTQPELPFDFGLLISILTTSVSGVLKRYEQFAQWMKPGSE